MWVKNDNILDLTNNADIAKLIFMSFGPDLLNLETVTGKKLNK